MTDDQSPNSSPTPRPILLFGGTFDPPHRAHVILPALVAEGLDCRRIIYIPAARSPFKTDQALTADEHRLSMLRIAIRDSPFAEISTIETDRGGVSYFVDTLERLTTDLGEDADVRFLIGADQSLAFHRWRDWPRILELATPAVMLRPPWTPDTFHDALVDAYGRDGAQTWISRTARTPRLDISATEIRRRIAVGADTSDLLDPAVAEYIAEHGLYVD